MKVLLLDGGSIQALPFLESYAKKGIKITLFCETRLCYGCFSLHRKKIVKCPKMKSSEFLRFIKEYLEMHPQDLIIPLFNDSAEFAAKHKEELEALGCKVEIPTWNTFIQAHDKEKLMDLCKELGVFNPRTANPMLIGYDKAIDYVGYPCLIKPNLSAGAKGIKIIHSKEDYEANFSKIVSQFGNSTIQEFIPQTGRQLKVQIYRGENGEIVFSSCYEKCRYYPVDGGTSTCNKIIEPGELTERYAKILEKIGWVGMADFDCIEDPRNGEILLMEINPRVPGTIKASFLGGVDVAEVMLCHATGQPYKKYEQKTGFYMRNLATEIVWFFAAKDRMSSKPNWWKFFGKDVYYVDGSWSDPFTFLGGFLGGFVKLMNPEFRKAKKK